MRRFLVVLAMAAPLAAAPPETLAERIRRVENGLAAPISERLAQQGVPGMSVAVIYGGKLDWARGYGVLEGGGTARVNATTLFQAASISKPVTALAALRLVELGKLALDADINQFLVSWKLPEGPGKVTLRRLLSHSAGLTVHGFRGYAGGEAVPTLLEVLDGRKPANSAPIRITLTPGTEWRYSGGGYCVLQQAMEDVTKQSFAELMRRLVLQPVGMERSTFAQPLPPDLAGNAASGHRAGGKPLAGRWHTYPEQAAAGLWTTPSDLAQFAMALIRVPQRLLGPALMREMLTRQIGQWGLGIGVSGAQFNHGGGNEGFRCLLVAYRDTGNGAVVMTNSDNGQLMMEVVRAVAAVYDWPDYRQP